MIEFRDYNLQVCLDDDEEDKKKRKDSNMRKTRKLAGIAHEHHTSLTQTPNTMSTIRCRLTPLWANVSMSV